MVSRTVAGKLGLKADWDLGENNWKDEMDANLLKLSVLVQGSVQDIVALEPAVPVEGDIVILDDTHATHPNEIAAYDEGAWVYIVPHDGLLLWNEVEGTYFNYTATAGWAEYAPAGGGGGGGAGDGVPWRDMAVGVPPLADFTQSNMGAAVVTESAGAAIIGSVAGGWGGIRMLRKAAPAAPYRIAVGASRVSFDIDGMRLLAGFRDSATGRLVTMMFTSTRIFVQTYSSETTFVATVLQVTSTLPSYGGAILGLRDDGTTLFFELSYDGVTFLTLYSVAKAGFYVANADEVFWGFGSNETNGGKAVLRLWDENGLARAY